MDPSNKSTASTNKPLFYLQVRVWGSFILGNNLAQKRDKTRFWLIIEDETKIRKGCFYEYIVMDCLGIIAGIVVTVVVFLGICLTV